MLAFRPSSTFPKRWASARASSGGIPESVASAYFQAIKAADWNGVAAQFTPDAQAKYRAMMTELIDAAAAAGQAEVRSMLLGKETTAEQAA